MGTKRKPSVTTLFTLGHSNRPIEAFLTLLEINSVDVVADVRAFPGSRHNPQYKTENLRKYLRQAGISYRHLPGLGGRRRPVDNSPNTGWINKSFQGYADYMRTSEFEKALESLIELALKKRVAIICAEAVPWRCHRNLISDALTVRNFRVEHILSPTRNQVHKITSWAKVRGTTITYRTDSQATMKKALKVGDHVSWNSEAGRVRGHIIKKLTRPTRFKGYVHHATSTAPQYLIKSDKTDHVALHLGTALRKLKT
ncbi:MAG: HVA1 family protein [Bdellovibrionia bacterium]